MISPDIASPGQAYISPVQLETAHEGLFRSVSAFNKAIGGELLSDTGQLSTEQLTGVLGRFFLLPNTVSEKLRRGNISLPRLNTLVLIEDAVSNPELPPIACESSAATAYLPEYTQAGFAAFRNALGVNVANIEFPYRKLAEPLENVQRDLPSGIQQVEDKTIVIDKGVRYSRDYMTVLQASWSSVAEFVQDQSQYISPKKLYTLLRALKSLQQHGHDLSPIPGWSPPGSLAVQGEGIGLKAPLPLDITFSAYPTNPLGPDHHHKNTIGLTPEAYEVVYNFRRRARYALKRNIYTPAILKGCVLAPTTNTPLLSTSGIRDILADYDSGAMTADYLGIPEHEIQGLRDLAGFAEAPSKS